MLTVENARQIIGYQSGRAVAKLNLQASTASDLPELGSVVEEYIVAAGSIAQIIRAAEIRTLDSDGTWYVS
jgi:hypothetical protein